MTDVDPIKSAVASIAAALTGSMSNFISNIMGATNDVDTALQRLAWTVAIIAGFVSIINSIRKWCKKDKKDVPD